MFANFENDFNVVFCLNFLGDLGDIKWLSRMSGKKLSDLLLYRNDFGRCFFTGLNTWLVIGVNVDKRGIKPNHPFE